jgi:hypothetical protein
MVIFGESPPPPCSFSFSADNTVDCGLLSSESSDTFVTIGLRKLSSDISATVTVIVLLGSMPGLERDGRLRYAFLRSETRKVAKNMY